MKWPNTQISSINVLSVFIILSHLCFRNSVRLAIRKLTYAPEEPAPQPSAETSKDFMMSPGNIKLEASLDKEVCLAEIVIFVMLLLVIG